MSQPTVLNYLEASSFAYNSGMTGGAPTGYSGTFTVDTNHFASRNDYDAYNPRTGFYGAAYTLGTGSDEDVVISFEGTNTAKLGTQPQFAISELRADYNLYKGNLPVALVQAGRFAQAVIASAEAQGISPDHIYLTGHSLGAAEADYADAATGLTGTTFGAPGISSNYVPKGSGSGLTDYVERGDPVGNYAYTGPDSPEGSFIYSDTIEHVGIATYLGSKYDAIPLQLAGQAYGTGDRLIKAQALAGFYEAAETYHPLSVYAASLHQNLTDPPAGATSFGGSSISHLIGAIAQRQG